MQLRIRLKSRSKCRVLIIGMNVEQQKESWRTRGKSYLNDFGLKRRKVNKR